MAKVSLSKITPIKIVPPVLVSIHEQDIEVTQYVPVQEKLAMIERILNWTIDNTGILNPVKLEIYSILEIISTYTNISITDKMFENAPKTYDSLMINGVIDKIIESIPEDEYNAIFDAIEECAECIITYVNSFAGMMKTVTENYDLEKMNVEGLMDDLGALGKNSLVKDVLEKIG